MPILARQQARERRAEDQAGLVFSHIDASSGPRQALDSGVTWWGWHVPALLEAAIVVALGLLMLGIAIWEFQASG